jgi:hypothetical protein
VRRAATLVLLALLPGCRFFAREPKTLDEARERMLEARDEAQSAADKGEVKGAKRAMKRAERVLESAVVRERCAPAAASPEAVCGEIHQAIVVARQHVELADETERRDAIVSGLKAKAYRATRKAVVKLAFEALAAAADQAARVGPDALPPEVLDSALQACALIGSTDPKQCDWKAAAAKARAHGNVQDDIGLLLAVGFAMMQKADLALIEADPLDCRTLGMPDVRECATYLTVLRGIVLLENGMPRLALREMEPLEAGASADTMTLSPRQMLAAWHVAYAYELLTRDNKPVEADEHLAQAMRFSPELASFFTGELPKPGGGYTRVPRSLEGLAHGTAFEASAEVLATRTRDLRDGKSAGGALLLDRRVIFELVLLYLRAEGKREPWARRTVLVIDRARAISGAVLAHLPGG